MVSPAELRAANRRGREMLERVPHAVSASFSAPYDRLLIQLSDGMGLLVDYRHVQGLESATPEDLSTVEISASGFGLFFDRLDADIWVPGLLQGYTGTARYMAAQMGARGGKASSKAKAVAARENGKRGGRPRKSAA